jgi:hypothetical protein
MWGTVGSYARYAGWGVRVSCVPQACAWGYRLMPATRAHAVDV